jgi:hypothetical protein
MALAKLSQDAKNFDFRSKQKATLATFFYSKGIIHKKFVPPGRTVNKEYYVEVLSRLVQRIRRVRPQFHEKGSWFLLHDYARPHTTVSVKQFLAKQGIPERNHPPPPPYSPDLFLLAFF